MHNQVLWELTCSCWSTVCVSAPTAPDSMRKVQEVTLFTRCSQGTCTATAAVLQAWTARLCASEEALDRMRALCQSPCTKCYGAHQVLALRVLGHLRQGVVWSHCNGLDAASVYLAPQVTHHVHKVGCLRPAPSLWHAEAADEPSGAPEGSRDSTCSTMVPPAPADQRHGSAVHVHMTTSYGSAARA